MRAAAVLVATVATVHADPCVERFPWLGVQDGAVVLCNTASCVKATPAGLGATVARTTHASAGSRVTAPAVIRGRSACNGATCKPLGSHLVAALAGNKASVTDDLKLVVIAHDAWNIAADRKLVLVKPAEYTAEPDTVPAAVAIDVVRDFLVVTWKGCAGPCDWAVVVDATGKNVGRRFPAGQIYQLDARRIAVLAGNAEPGLTILDAATGARLGSAEVGGNSDDQLVRAPDGTLVAWSFDRLAWFDISGPAPKQIAELRPRECL